LKSKGLKIEVLKMFLENSQSLSSISKEKISQTVNSVIQEQKIEKKS